MWGDEYIPEEIKLSPLYTLDYLELTRILAKQKDDLGNYRIGLNHPIWLKHTQWWMKEYDLTPQQMLMKATNNRYYMQIATLLKYYWNELIIYEYELNVEERGNTLKIDTTSYDTHSLLYKALSDDLKLLKLILIYAPESEKDYIGYMIVDNAVLTGRLSLLQIAMENSHPNLNWLNNENMTILEYSADISHNQLSIVKYLVSIGVDLGKYRGLYLNSELLSSNIEFIRFLLSDKDGDFSQLSPWHIETLVEQLERPTSWDPDGQKKEKIRLLLDNEALVKQLDSNLVSRMRAVL